MKSAPIHLLLPPQRMIKQIVRLLSIPALWLLPAITSAQTYTPSNRIPVADNSQIGTQVSGANNNFNITGGLQRGQNLFHSFTDFSVPTGGAANFANPTGNQSIITRVTGNLFSDINGTLKTNGANFLLINPNGVVFGSGVKLDVGKAFVTSTASGVDFVDAAGRNYNFGTNRAGDAPLLSIDPNVAFNPARLIMNTSIPGSRGIENNGTLETNNSGQYIGLIGGNVTFDGGQLIAPGAKVELGGLAQSGTVGFSFENGVKFPANVDLGNVSLVQNGTAPSVIDVRSGGGGSVGIFAKDLNLKGTGSIVGDAGDISLNATGEIVVNASNISLGSESATSVVGNILVISPKITLDNGATITAESISGKGANIYIGGNLKAQSTLTGSYINNLTEADFLILRHGSLISTNAGTATLWGGGDGGDININSTWIVAIAKENSDITANAFAGRGGNILIIYQGIFGLRYSLRPTENSDILASSSFGILQTLPTIDPPNDTGKLPAAPNDASKQISQACGVSQLDNKFYITGRGGLPPNASEPQESEALWEDARAVKAKPVPTASQPQRYAPPAIGWVYEKNGRVRLIAAQTADGVTGTSIVCPNK